VQWHQNLLKRGSVWNEPPETLLVSIADKLYNARAILEDYRQIGSEVWSRFKRGREQQLWYFNESHQNLRREMSGMADCARTKTNRQRTLPDFRSRQNFGAWTNRLEFGTDALN
jgi:hypothetical protein